MQIILYSENVLCKLQYTISYTVHILYILCKLQYIMVMYCLTLHLYIYIYIGSDNLSPDMAKGVKAGRSM